jgi:hypothetical protein
MEGLRGSKPNNHRSENAGIKYQVGECTYGLSLDMGVGRVFITAV